MKKNSNKNKNKTKIRDELEIESKTNENLLRVLLFGESQLWNSIRSGRYGWVKIDRTERKDYSK